MPTSKLQPPPAEGSRAATMWGSLASRYDLSNRFISLGFDGNWRRFAARHFGLSDGDRALDIASGTDDLAFELAGRVGPTGKIAALDLTREMLVLARAKNAERHETRIDHHLGHAMHLPYKDDAFQLATMAFACRYLPDLTLAFSEMARVVAPGGRVMIIELAQPETWLFRQFLDLNLRTVSPLAGGLSSHFWGVYEYLPRRVAGLHKAHDIVSRLREVGLSRVVYHTPIMGVAKVFVGEKPVSS